MSLFCHIRSGKFSDGIWLVYVRWQKLGDQRQPIGGLGVQKGGGQVDRQGCWAWTTKEYGGQMGSL